MELGRKLKAATQMATGVMNTGNWRTLFVVLRARKMQPAAECPICGYHGGFDAGGILAPRMNAACPRCHSMERHRLLMLAIKRGKIDLAGKRILHFAPEAAVKRIVEKAGAAAYLSADLDPTKAMRSINIEAMDLPSRSFDTVICSHILEHVDHVKALGEIHRVLAPGGVAILMFPIVEAWRETYEDARYQATPEDRTAHFGQDDHIKFFGRDVCDRICEAGFELERFIADGEDSARYALIRGETIFLATRPRESS